MSRAGLGVKPPSRYKSNRPSPSSQIDKLKSLGYTPGIDDYEDTSIDMDFYNQSFKDSRDELISEAMKTPTPDPDYVRPKSRSDAGYEPVVSGGDNVIKYATSALGFIESTNNYTTIGEVAKKGYHKGERPYGKYGVMTANIAPWTKKYYGKSLTPEQFLANQEAQDAVVAGELAANYKKYGNIEDAVSIWFTGRPLKTAQEANAADNNIGVDEYMRRFRVQFNKQRRNK